MSPKNKSKKEKKIALTGNKREKEKDKLTGIEDEDYISLLQAENKNIKNVGKIEEAENLENENGESEWLMPSYEGQLSVDVYQTKDKIVIQSTIAGVDPDDIDISITTDKITIKGERKRGEDIDPNNYFHEELFWGKFSRSIILPVEVRSNEVEAIIKNGLLTLILPKVERKKIHVIKVKSED